MDTLTRIEPALEESLTAKPSLTAAQVQGQQVAAGQETRGHALW